MKPLAGVIGLIGLLAVPALGQVYVPPGGVMPVKGMTPARMATVPYTGPAVVIGQIVDAVTGRGVAHAIVHLEGQGTEVTRVADNSGRFYVTGLTSGDYAINATKAGYFDGAYGQRRVGGQGLPLSMLEHQWAPDLKIALWRPAVIGGTITDEAGEPLVGVRVDALRKQYDGGVLQLVPWMTDLTDDEGEYRIARLLPGDYVIAVPSVMASLPDALASNAPALDNMSIDERSGYALLPGFMSPPPPIDAPAPAVYPTTYYGSTPRMSTALTLTVASGETRLGANLQLRPVPRGAISGTVIGPNGPMPNQPLRLLVAGEGDPGFGHETAITISTATGDFSFPVVPQGDYLVEAPSQSVLGLSYTIDPRRQSDPQTVVGWATVEAASETDDDSNAKPLVWGRAHVTLADRDVTGVKIEMQPTVTVSGHVVFESTTAKPPQNLSQHIALDATPSGGLSHLSRHAKVADDGAFVIRGLARGEYFLRAGEPPAGWYIKAVMSAGHDLLSSPLDLSTIGDVDDLEVIFTDKPTEIGGVVYNAVRAPVGGATVVVFPAESSYRGTAGQHPDRVRAIRATNAGGYHLAALPAGDYYIAAIDESAADAWQDPRRLEVIRAGAKRLTVKAGDHVPIDLQLITRR